MCAARRPSYDIDTGETGWVAVPVVYTYDMKPATEATSTTYWRTLVEYTVETALTDDSLRIFRTQGTEPETEQDQAARQERVRRLLEDQERAGMERRKKREAAAERGRELLRSVLTEDQRAAYAETGRFLVTGSNGFTYEITQGFMGNVHKLDSQRRRRVRYCAHPRLVSYDTGTRERLPDEDVMAAQVLALRTDAPGFEEIANVHYEWDEHGAELSWHRAQVFAP